ncbi:MAG: rhodanese-like domain-containing protein [Pseudomonadota bacterium]
MKSLYIEDAPNFIQATSPLIIDVREDDEWEEGYIPGAIHVALSQLPFAIQGVEFQKEQPVIFYCKGGVRSAKVIEFLSQNYLKDYQLYNLEGGITEWAAHNNQVVMPE